MNERKSNIAVGCLFILFMCLIILLIRWLFVVGVLWLIIFCLGFFGTPVIHFNLGLATAVWLILELVSFFTRNKK